VRRDLLGRERALVYVYIYIYICKYVHLCWVSDNTRKFYELLFALRNESKLEKPVIRTCRFHSGFQVRALPS